VLILTVAAAAGVCVGGHLGGTLVYRHGTGVSVPVASAQANAAGTELLGHTTQ